MKKSDLKSGMVVVIRDRKYVLIGDNFVNDTGFIGLEGYDEDLKYKYSSDIGEWDITKVYSAPNWGRGFTERLSTLYASKLLWDREREVDWGKIPKGTKVQILTKEIDGCKWINRYFISQDHRFLKTSSIPKDDDFTQIKMCDYEFCKVSDIDNVRIHPNVQIREEWRKHER